LCRCIIAPGIVGLSGNLGGTIDQNNIKNIVETHLGALEPEFRWLFAIDMERVAGEPIDSCFFSSPSGCRYSFSFMDTTAKYREVAGEERRKWHDSPC
jgi:hypothetical protein